MSNSYGPYLLVPITGKGPLKNPPPPVQLKSKGNPLKEEGTLSGLAKGIVYSVRFLTGHVFCPLFYKAEFDSINYT